MSRLVDVIFRLSSSCSGFIFISVPPDAPSHLHVIGVSEESVTIEWSAPYSSGSLARISGYVIEKRDSSTQIWTSVTHVSSRTTTYKVCYLDSSSSYYIRIAAENEEGIGAWLEMMTPVRPTKPRSKYITCS